MLSTCNRAEIYAVGDTDATRRRRRALLQRVSQAAARSGRANTCTFAAARMRRGTCSASPPGSTRWSSASRRFSARSRRAYSTASDLALHRHADQSAVPLGVRRGQARARGNRPWRRGGVGQLCGDRAGEEDLRAPEGAERAHPRRRRDGQAHRRPPAGAAGQGDRDREPDVGGRANGWRRSWAAGRSRGRRSTTPWPTPTSSSPPPARRSRC